ncbi:MAG TPA: N(4)-(beta-N-acetylglucosaminyl)-L-asparaginase [Vicinamibacterales bacterium]|nr:N(4)-(beta-N-acetylglucosaminyl)-L-asparaginase [Vicinamibacterales bacterium]
MQAKLTRRDFVTGGAAAGAAAMSARLFGQPPGPVPSGRAPEMLVRRTVRPVVIASANGHRFRNGGDQTCVEKAFSLITAGQDVLDAVIAGVNIVELDPEDTSVGYGGLPNADGVVQLDASVMHGPKKRAGAVGALEGVRTPSLVAKAVMEHTDHHLLVGRDAQMFARRMGFTIEDDLNTERSRKAWLEWKRRTDPDHYLDPAKRQEAAWRVLREMIAEGLVDEEHVYGTINCDGIGPNGAICGVTTTSGLAWKIPGRLGDSPIFGAGLYVDGAVGAAGSTGRGEANLFNCSSFLIVELMRRGLHPKDAGLEALKRIQAATVEKRLLNGRGLPAFNVSFYILNARGEYAGVALYGGERARFAVCDEKGARLEPLEPLLSGAPSDD